ncbi:MAG: ribosomal protein S18-alanine N-acetyltransferase [Magnetococcales bacterium]|nr:ribosomal protein S18-alanine N-acetyltransferase [Magnetococcales bacterium]
MRISIENMEKKHIDKVVHLDSKIAHNPWSTSMFLEELNLNSFCRVLVDEYGDLFGYGVSRPQVDEWHLLTVGVDSKLRRQGYGKRLVVDVIRKAALNLDKAVLLEVRASNNSAINLYKKIGFETLHIREKYYKSATGPEDAVVMKRLVKESDREKFS